MKKKIIIEVPEHLVDVIEEAGHYEKMVTIEKNQLKVPLPRVKNESIIKMSWVLLPTILSTLVFMVMNFNRKNMPLSGDNSVASYIITIGIILTFVLFSTFFVLGKTGKVMSHTQDIYWRNFPSILISIGLIMVVVLLASFRLLEQLFLGVTFDLITSSLLFFVVIGVISYVMISMALKITPSILINLLMVIAIGGVGIAMLTNSEQQWWLSNLSYLGSSFAVSSWRFNLTLVLASLIMIALIDFLFEAIFKVQPRSNQLRFMKFLLLMLALFLGGVGVFPVNDSVISRELHNFFAQGLVFWVLILMIGVQWLLPTSDKEFTKLTYGMAIVLVVVTLLFKVVYYLSLTAFEIIAFVVAFSWLLLLLNKLIQLSNYGSQSFRLDIEIRDKD